MSKYLLILVITVLIILFVWLLNKRERKFWLDDNGLHWQPLFWLLITTPLIISIILWLLISDDYESYLTQDGYSQFIEYAKLPLLVLTLSPILGAFVINAHRSIQTAKQIEVTEKKNKVDIYIARRNFIIERLKNLVFLNKINVNVIYDYFYTFDNYTDIINKDHFLFVEKRIDAINELTNKIISYKTLSPLNKNIFADIHLLLNIISYLLEGTGLKSYYIDELKEISKELEEKIDNNAKYGDDNYLNDLSIFLLDFTYILSQIHSSLHELFTILILEKKVEDYLPNLEKLIISPKGDKVATENQNYHE